MFALVDHFDILEYGIKQSIHPPAGRYLTKREIEAKYLREVGALALIGPSQFRVLDFEGVRPDGKETIYRYIPLNQFGGEGVCVRLRLNCQPQFVHPPL